MKKYHDIKDIIFSEENMKITIDGKHYSYSISEISERLKNALQIDRENYIITASGYGIHWPNLDEDLSIDGLLGIGHKHIKAKRKIAS